ncbi:hypothetical protein F5X99DRAFT_335975 [Biscogniauxia marginata]|nr:hypothetical protein F5X99DRAFT_335975 [Biscogniauxia marginata]
MREPSPNTDALSVEPIDVEEVTTIPPSSEPIVNDIPQQAVSTLPMANQAGEEAMLSEEQHVTPSKEQQVLPESRGVPSPQESQLAGSAEQAEVIKETFDQALPQSPVLAPAQSEEPLLHLDGQQIDLTNEPKNDSQPDQEPKTEAVIQVEDHQSQSLQPDTALIGEPHQKLHEHSTVGESEQASQNAETVEDPSPQVVSSKKSKKKKKRQSQVESEPEYQPQLDSTIPLQDPQEPEPLHEELSAPEKVPELQPVVEDISTVAQDEATPQDALSQDSPSKKSKKKKKKRATQVDLEPELGNETFSESQVQSLLPAEPPAKELPIEGISTEPTKDSPAGEIFTEKYLAEASTVEETPVQEPLVKETYTEEIPEELPSEEPKQETNSPGKSEEEEVTELKKTAEPKEASSPDEVKNERIEPENSGQEVIQPEPKEEALESEEAPAQHPPVQEVLRQPDNHLIVEGQVMVERKEGSQDLSSEIVPSKESENEKQATENLATADIVIPEATPRLSAENDQAARVDTTTNTEQLLEPVSEPTLEHSRLGSPTQGTRELGVDGEATGAVSEQNLEVNEEQGSPAISQRENIVESIPAENKVGTSNETPQGYADDSPELSTTQSEKDENKKSDTDSKPEPPLDAQIPPLQDRSFKSVANQPITHEPKGVEATESIEKESGGKGKEHKSTQDEEGGQPRVQMPIETAIPGLSTVEREKSKNEGPVGSEIAGDGNDTTEVAPLEGLSDSPKQDQDKNQKNVDQETPDEDSIDYSTVRENWERKARANGRSDANAGDYFGRLGTKGAGKPETRSKWQPSDTALTDDQPLSQTPKKTIIDNIEIESPVVARETIRKLFESRRGPQDSPKRGEPEISEIIQNLDSLDTSEDQTPSSASKEAQQPIIPVPTTPNFGRHSPGNLPPVEEETREELENESRSRPRDSTGKVTDIRTGSRDSGVVMDALYPLRLSFLADKAKRESDVHVRDEPEPESTPTGQDGPSGVDEIGAKPGLSLGSKDEASQRSTPNPEKKGSETPASGNKTPEPEAEPSTPIHHEQSVADKPLAGGKDEGAKSTSAADVKKTRSSKYADLGVGEIPAASPRQEQRSASDKINREANASPLSGPQPRRSASNTSISRLRTPEPLTFRPEGSGSYAGTNTPPLRRRAKRMSGDLRSLSQPTKSDPNLPSKDLSDRRAPDNTTPVANEGRVRGKDMTDVYDGYGEGRIGSPRSPTRPHSMRRRQSMQVLELEARVEQLLADNRALAEARQHAEQSLTYRTTSALTERDAEIESLKASLQWLRNEVSRLTEVNEGLHSANNVLALQNTEKYSRLERQHASAAQELEEYRGSRGQYTKTLQEKDAEIQDLRAQLEASKEQIREMQKQILASKPPDAEFLRLRDEDYFDHRCQQLCSHVQQWVLRFSKFSDMRASRLTSEINDEKIIDRLDNSVLDGSEVDSYLRDRVRRRDIFMSMTMNMIWEFVFTRYLFGMDREQRQKLKSVEKLLTEVGPPQAVRQWRAVTLTLLSKRPAFGDQRNQDTEAVVQAILRTLSMILPPPSNLESQIQSQLRRVMREAVDLSIEMRTQRAEYVMLPPLQPEYDPNGDLAQTVAFNAALMNERSGDSVSNEELEAQGAIVRCVLFPLVVKKGDDNGVGDDEIVVCPAQVLVSKPRSRTVTPTSETKSAQHSRNPTPSSMGPSVVSVSMPDAMRSVAGSTWSVD